MTAIIKSNVDLSPEEKEAYVKYVETKYAQNCEELVVEADNGTDYVHLSYKLVHLGFERIRREIAPLVYQENK